jgi:hypothetical protein
MAGPCGPGFDYKTTMEELMMRSKSNTFTDLSDRLIDKGYRTLAVTAFVGLGAAQFAASVLQKRKRRIHMWLLRQRAAETQAGHDHYSDESFWRETTRRIEALPTLTFSSPGSLTR